MRVAQAPQHRQEFRRWNVNAAANLNRFDEDRADFFVAHPATDHPFDGPKFLQASREGSKPRKLAKLTAKGKAKMLPMRGVERAIAHTMISALERNYPSPARRQHRRLERRLDRLKT